MSRDKTKGLETTSLVLNGVVNVHININYKCCSVQAE